MMNKKQLTKKKKTKRETDVQVIPLFVALLQMLNVLNSVS